MAEERRMTAAQVVDKLMGSEHADVVRESVAWLVGRADGGRGRRRRSAPSSARSRRSASRSATATGRGRGRRAPARSSWRSRSCAQGSYFPSFLEPRKRAEQALVAVVQEAYVNGVSTRKVDRLVEQLGVQG